MSRNWFGVPTKKWLHRNWKTESCISILRIFIQFLFSDETGWMVRKKRPTENKKRAKARKSVKASATWRVTLNAFTHPGPFAAVLRASRWKMGLFFSLNFFYVEILKIKKKNSEKIRVIKSFQTRKLFRLLSLHNSPGNFNIMTLVHNGQHQ